MLERGFATLMLLWLTVITVEPRALHSCPTHGGALPPRSGEPAAHGDHDEATHAFAHHAPNEDGREQHQCTCIGKCNTGSSVTGLAAAPLAFSAATVWLPRIEIHLDESAIVVSPPFLLPFANGPPAISGVA